MAYVLCLKPMHVVSLTGHSLLLEEKLAPQRVPDEVVPELLRLGCVPCDEEGNVIVTGVPLAVRRMKHEDLPLYQGHKALVANEPEPPTVSEEMKIDEAVKAIIEAKDSALMNAKLGFPKVYAVSERVGFKVTQLQIVASCKRLGYC
jgi:hypothetical protein